MPHEHARSRWRTPPRPFRRRLPWGQFAIVLAIAGAALLAGRTIPATPTVSVAMTTTPAAIDVVDGDTVRIDGRLTRLVGFNTPETFEPRCVAEQQLGNRARQRLRALVASGPVSFAEVPCACRPGTEGTSECNYGRACGILRIDGGAMSARC